MKRKGHSVDLGAALDGVLGRLDRKSGGAFASAKAARAWEAVAGDLVTSHTTGAHLKDRKLVVYVDSPAWATELSAMAEQYRLSLNEGLGQDAIRSIVFTVSRKVADEHRIFRQEAQTEEFYAADRVEPIALTPVERAQVEASAARIPDEGVREAAIRATIKDMEWKKGIAVRNSPQAPREGL